MFWLLAPGSAAATTFTVPSEDTPTLAAAVAVAEADSLIRVDASLYKGETSSVEITVDLGIAGFNGIPELPPLGVYSATLTLDDLDLGGRLLNQPIAFEDLATAQPQNADYHEGAHALQVVDAVLVGSNIGIESGGAEGLVGSEASISLYTVDVIGFDGPRAIDLLGPGTLYIQDGSFYDTVHGAIRTSGLDVDIDGITFHGNSGVQGSDLYLTGTVESVVISDLTTTEASADADGGSIYAAGVGLEVYASAFTGVSAGGQGGAVLFDGTLGGVLSVDGTTFASTNAASLGGAISALSATVDLTNLTFTGTVAGSGGAVALVGSVLDAADIVVDGATASYGGAFYGDLTSMVVRRYQHEVDGSSAMAQPEDGGAFYLSNSSLELYAPITSGIEVAGDGAVIHAQSSTVEVRGGTTDLARADQYGALIHAVDTSVIVKDHVARDGDAFKGSAIFVSGGTLLVQDSTFKDNRATFAGVLHAAEASWVEVTRNWFCTNHGGGGASVLQLDGGLELDVVQNNVFLGNDNAEETGFVLGSVIAMHQSNLATNDTDHVQLTNNTLVDNAPHSTLLDLQETRVAVVNNIFMGPGPVVGGLGTRLWFLGDYNLFHNTVPTNDVSTFPSFHGSHAVYGNPQFQGYVQGSCDSTLWLERTSPAIDAGHPAIFDLDFTRSDIGAYGGPFADLWDADGDNSFVDADCNDDDDSIYPGAPEIPYDTIDQDCDGADLVDVDRDGWAGGPSGPDCDDSADDIHPGATEIPYDGVDQDCVGGDLVDVDLDGWKGWQVGGADCNDQVGAINPEAAEIWYDGVDQDCDGNDEDQDEDGFSAEVVGGTDCDDLDERIHPLAEDLLDDGIDQNCDGFQDHSWLVGGPRGCSTAPVPAGAGFMWFLVAFVRRRRSS
ncbi:MAG: putative metal-binding motif-containing protein [Deltaproteobacteria bacterium]|nr:putative metal-binding motif-containing protein [Deltaproteobacteria bacterium]